MRDQPVVGLALGLHGAALGGRNLRGDFGQRRVVLAFRQAVGAEFSGADQPAMHDQVGIAADGRGEVRVAAQVQAEVAVVLGRIFGLRLRAQHHLVDELLDVLAFDLVEDAVELLGAQRAALGQRDVQRFEEFAQRLDLLQRRLVVHAIDQRHARLLERFGGRHVGEDHELLDQPVRTPAAPA